MHNPCLNQLIARESIAALADAFLNPLDGFQDVTETDTVGSKGQGLRQDSFPNLRTKAALGHDIDVHMEQRFKIEQKSAEIE